MPTSMHLKKLLLLCLMAALLPVMCSGCMLRSVDELYTLPRQTDAYYNLQNEIDKVITGSVDYCAPSSGENRQPVHIQDLNGDGIGEALVFARDSGAKPLKIFVFSRLNDSFQLVSTIEGEGTSFDSVDYVQMDGSPGKEILVGRSISEQVLKSISVYSFQGNSTVELMSANYTSFTTFDLDTDGRHDLFLIRFEAETQSGNVELYRYSEGVMARDPELTLSEGVTSVKRMITGYINKEVPAVFVAGRLDETLITTDVFAIHDGVLQNIAPQSGASSATVRNYYVYSTDIDGDGLIELPEVELLPPGKRDESPQFRVIHWYNLDLQGQKYYKMLTYHDYFHGFYLQLDSTWKGNLTMSRDDSIEEGLAYSFNYRVRAGAEEEHLFTIYLLSGDHRNELAQQGDRFILADKNEVTFAASIGDSTLSEKLTKELLKESFHFISMDWNSGEM